MVLETKSLSIMTLGEEQKHDVFAVLGELQGVYTHFAF